MCSRMFKGMVLLAALAVATGVGAVFGGSAVYVLSQLDDVSPVVEIRAGDRRSNLPPVAPRRHVVWGVVVLAAIEDSPASLAGLRAGDVIIALNGAPIVSPESLAVKIAQQEPGDEAVHLPRWPGKKGSIS